jgi:hypothetical protein
VCWDSKSRIFDNFSGCKSRECVYLVIYGSTIKLSGRRRLYNAYICYAKLYHVNH